MTTSSDGGYPEGYTIGIFLPKEATRAEVEAFRHKIAEAVYEFLENRGEWDPMIVEFPRDILMVDKQGCECCPQPHIYFSTSCFHGDHNYCKRETGLLGNKIPGVCKFCKAPCICRCHRATDDSDNDDNVDG